MKSNARVLLLCFCVSLLIATAACGILNLGATNEDGSPKTALEARAFIRSLGDAAIQTWGSDALREKAPQVMALFDVDRNNVLTLPEVESVVNAQDPNSMTMLLVMAIELYRSRPK